MKITTLRFANINYRMSLWYIAKNAELDNLVKECGFGPYSPICIKIPWHRPGVCGTDDEDDLWTEGQVPYDGASRRKILGKVLELGVVKDLQQQCVPVWG